MTNGLTMRQAKWLTYLIWVLITLLTGVVIFQFNLIAGQNSRICNIETLYRGIPDKYISIERYNESSKLVRESYTRDLVNIYSRMNTIDAKLDRLIERILKQ